uniref:Portal protein n=1 Tax=viral metagenome TaxID=1070528 RepID=A0A6M3IN61_9ZZZZ
MALESVSEELDRKKTQQNRLTELYARMERHFNLWRHKKFEISSKEGVWDTTTTNSASVLGNGIADRISRARRKLWIPVIDETRKRRKELTSTERFVNAALQLNDDRLQMVPEMVDLQSGLGFHAAIRGIICVRTYLYMDDGNFIADVMPWDPLHVSWISGGVGNPLPWVCHERYASVEEIGHTYGNKVKERANADKQGRVLISDIWDNEEEGVILDTGTTTNPSQGDYISKEKHGIGHPPVLILPCGSAPYIQSNDDPDTIKNLGASAYINNEDLYETRSRSLSYRLTLAGRAAKTDRVLYYDSTLGGLPPDVEGDVNAKGALIALDKGKGQELVAGIQPQMSRDAEILDNEISRELSVGGMAPVAFGQIDQSLPFGGISLLTDSALQRLAVAQGAVEQAFAHVAGEIVSQFKTGDFGQVTLKGLETSNKAYEIKVASKDIDDSWRFQCRLIPDLPQNEQIIAAVATQMKTGRLMSTRDIQEKYQLVEDFDLTEERMDIEDADAISGWKLRRMIRAVLEDTNSSEDAVDMARELLDHLAEQKGARTQAAQGGQAVQPGIPIPAPPMAAAASSAQPPGGGGVRNALSRMMGR